MGIFTRHPAWFEVFETSGTFVSPDGQTARNVDALLPDPSWEATEIGPALDRRPTTSVTSRRGPRRRTVPSLVTDTYPNRWVVLDPRRAQLHHLSDPDRPDPRRLRSTLVGEYDDVVYEPQVPNRAVTALTTVAALFV